MAALVKDGVKVIVQPSSRRIFADSLYTEAGAVVDKDLSPANMIIGVKQVPVDNIMNDKSYVFFSHTIKAQPENMKLLDACVERNVSLYDYECIVGADGVRLVAFGEYAGMVGMIDILQGLGVRLLADGYSTPFLSAPLAYMQPSLALNRTMVRKLGERIATEGLPAGLGPLVFTFTGGGNVGRGAKGIFELLPVKMVKPEDLAALTAAHAADPTIRHKTLYGCYLETGHLVRKVAKANAKRNAAGFDVDFDEAHYFAHPEGYEGVFHELVAPHTSVLVNGMYWDNRYPRLLTTAQAANLGSAPGGQRLRAIADVSCDMGGSLEFCDKTTTFEQPYYEWNAAERTESPKVGSRASGVVVNAVDILPSALPFDATNHFGDKFLPVLKDLLTASAKGYPAPTSMERARITHGGRLTDRFAYITKYREERARTSEAAAKLAQKSSVLLDPDWPRATFLFQGHLFDSKFINTAFDVIEKRGAFEILDFLVVPNMKLVTRESQMSIALSAPDAGSLAELVEDLTRLGNLLDVRVQELDHAPGATVATNKESRSSGGRPLTAAAAVPKRKVLLLGSGLVAAPFVDYLTRSGRASEVHLTVASDSKIAAQRLAARAPGHVTAVELAIKDASPEDAAGEAWSAELGELVAAADVVVSLLPPPFHANVAKRCIAGKSHLVTASYVSPAMAELHESARAAGIVILNEMGLDPGMDHMSAMKLIDEVKRTGGVVRAFKSVCGGLSSPDALDPTNPLQYAFSWSPAGVISAALTPAKYLEGGAVVDIDGLTKLDYAAPFKGFPSLNLEYYANRDSVGFGDQYKIKDTAHSVFRGTLRFGGWCDLMRSFSILGLCDGPDGGGTGALAKGGATWGEVLAELAAARGAASPEAVLGAALGGDGDGPERAAAAMHCLAWLGMGPDDRVVSGDFASVQAAFVKTLSDKLTLQPGQRDLVVMQHDFEFEWPEGAEGGARKEHHVSSLIAFGGAESTAMAQTVGVTAAIGTDLVLEGHLDNHTGLASPLLPSVYDPGLERLAAEGFVFNERFSFMK